MCACCRACLCAHRAVTRVLGELILFCTEASKSGVGAVTDGKFVGNAIDIIGLPVPSRQRLILEQNMLPMLIAILTTPFKDWGGRYDLSEIREQQERLRLLQKRRAMLVSHDRLARMESREMTPILAEEDGSDGERATPSSGAPAGTSKAMDARSGPDLGRGLGRTSSRRSYLSRTSSRGSRRNALASLLNVKEPDSQLLAIHRVTKLVYKLIRHVFRDSRENENKVAAYMDVFIKQLGFDVTAEETLTQLLTNNLQLLERLQVDQINVFLQFIRESGKKPEFLDFLAALCSCLGRGVPANQELICDLIFGDGDGLLRDGDGDVDAAGLAGISGRFGDAGMVDAIGNSSMWLRHVQDIAGVDGTSFAGGEHSAVDVIGGADVILPTREQNGERRWPRVSAASDSKVAAGDLHRHGPAPVIAMASTSPGGGVDIGGLEAKPVRMEPVRLRQGRISQTSVTTDESGVDPWMSRGDDSIPLEVFVGKLPSMKDYLRQRARVGSNSRDGGESKSSGGKSSGGTPDPSISRASMPRTRSEWQLARQEYVKYINHKLDTAPAAEWVAVMDLYVALAWHRGACGTRPSIPTTHRDRTSPTACDRTVSGSRKRRRSPWRARGLTGRTPST